MSVAFTLQPLHLYSFRPFDLSALSRLPRRSSSERRRVVCPQSCVVSIFTSSQFLIFPASALNPQSSVVCPYSCIVHIFPPSHLLNFSISQFLTFSLSHLRRFPASPIQSSLFPVRYWTFVFYFRTFVFVPWCLCG